LVAPSGVITESWHYDSWGNPISPLARRIEQPFLWNGAFGYEYIPFTGLYHVGAREYDPRTARWLQRDPIEAASGDPNPYRYCTNDSINFVDPDGLNPDWGKLFDIGIGFVPIVGALWDIGKGIAEGDWTRVGVGAVSLVVDVATLGASRVAVGAARAGVAGARMIRGAADCQVLITIAKGTARVVIDPQKLQFANQNKLTQHATKHGHEFGVKSASDYLKRAQAFVGRTNQSSVLKHIGQTSDHQGKTYLYDSYTDKFDVTSSDGKIILTYFKPGYDKRTGRVDKRRAWSYWQNQLKK
jgi:RHS repeat-associated protein